MFMSASLLVILKKYLHSWEIRDFTDNLCFGDFIGAIFSIRRGWQMRSVSKRFSGSFSNVRLWMRCCSLSTAQLGGLSRVYHPCLTAWRGWSVCCWMGCTDRQYLCIRLFSDISVSNSILNWFFFYTYRDFNLEESLEGISAQICCELNKSLTERSYPALTPALQGTLTGQICNITHKDNPIRTLVGKRE